MTTPDTFVWIAAPRAGISYHHLDDTGRKTICGRYVGTETQVVNGYLQPLAEVVNRFGSQLCRACDGSSVSPRIRRPTWTS